MPSRELDELESFDVMSLTISDLASMKNAVLRRALVTAIESGLASGATHTNHWAFQSHAQAAPHILAGIPTETQEA